MKKLMTLILITFLATSAQEVNAQKAKKTETIIIKTYGFTSHQISYQHCNNICLNKVSFCNFHIIIYLTCNYIVGNMV